MVDGGRNIAAQHAQHVECDAERCPGLVSQYRVTQEKDATHDAQQNARGVAPSIPGFFPCGIKCFLFHDTCCYDDNMFRGGVLSIITVSLIVLMCITFYRTHLERIAYA